MARITVEDCLQNCENRFALVHIAAKRARELFKGVDPLIRCKNREVVTALREIAAGKVGFVDEEPAAAPAKKASKKS
jgi:DNA-directed RNA polymerase subunit omega